MARPPRGEGDDERAEVQRQQGDPQQWCRDEVRDDERRHRGQQTGRDRRQQEPAPAAPPVDGGGRVRRRGEGTASISASVAPPAECRPGAQDAVDAGHRDGEEDDEDGVADGPRHPLVGQAEARLDDEGIGQQGRAAPLLSAYSGTGRRRPCSALATSNQPDTSGVVVVRTSAASHVDEQDADEVDDRRDPLVAQQADVGRGDDEGGQGQAGQHEVQRRAERPGA